MHVADKPEHFVFAWIQHRERRYGVMMLMILFLELDSFTNYATPLVESDYLAAAQLPIGLWRRAQPGTQAAAIVPELLTPSNSATSLILLVHHITKPNLRSYVSCYILSSNSGYVDLMTNADADAEMAGSDEVRSALGQAEQACAQCRRRKKGCDKLRPRCTQCRR